MSTLNKIPKKYQPRGFEIVYDDVDLIVGNKSPGLLTVEALWEKSNTVHNLLNQYVKKGNSRSNKCVYVVHRLDQATSGVLIFAKSEKVQTFLKENWKATTKTYYAIVHGKMRKPEGKISSYLEEDDEYMIRSTGDTENGKLAHTEYKVLKETPKFSLLQINLLTGRKNQIRVHLSEEGNPIVGDTKYGSDKKYKDLALHSHSIEFNHPHSKKRMKFEVRVPGYFTRLVDYPYETSLPTP